MGKRYTPNDEAKILAFAEKGVNTDTKTWDSFAKKEFVGREGRNLKRKSDKLLKAKMTKGMARVTKTRAHTAKTYAVSRSDITTRKGQHHVFHHRPGFTPAKVTRETTHEEMFKPDPMSPGIPLVQFQDWALEPSNTDCDAIQVPRSP